MEVQRLMEHMDRGRKGEADRQTRPCLPGRASGSKWAENAKAQRN